MTLTSLICGDSHRHALGRPYAVGLGDPVACVYSEGIARVRPELAHTHSTGAQIHLLGQEDDIRTTGQAELEPNTWRHRSRGFSSLFRSRLDYRSQRGLTSRSSPRAQRLSQSVVATGTPGLTLTATDQAVHAVSDVSSPSQPARGAPLQDHRGLVHHRDQLLRGRRGFWETVGVN